MRQSLRTLHSLLLVVLVAAPAAARTPGLDAEAAAFARHVDHLAAPTMEGRGVGTEGLDRARDYLVKHFQAIGLEPPFRDEQDERRYTQPSEVSLGVRATEQSLTLEDTDGASVDVFEPGSELNALGFSGEGRFRGEAVFVGYGIVAPEHGYDSYAGLAPDALAGKVALAFRYEPMSDRARSRWAERGQWSEAATLTNKARWAAEHGATALLVVDPPKQQGNRLRSTRGSAFGDGATIPVLHVRQSVLERALLAAGRDPSAAIRAWQQRADAGELTPDVLEDAVFAGSVELDRPTATIHNVGGILPGRGALADETIVVGAHYDHLGHGEIGSRDGPDTGRIHPGADDNASGTAALIMLAGRMKQWADASPERDRRAIVFVGFSGEERGLLGSSYLVNHPEEFAVPFEGVVTMVNLDMIGRLRDDQAWVFGTQTGEGLADVFEHANHDVGLDLETGGAGLGHAASDHASFVMKGVPSVHLFTGVHEDYHRPGDTADKVNAVGGARIVRLVAGALETLATTPAAPRFVADSILADPHDRTTLASGGAYLGVMPDYATLDGGDGAAISGIVPGGPAARAGLRDGDVIIDWAGEPIRNVRDLTARLGEAEPGEPLTITVLRRGERVELDVELGRR